MSNDGDAARGQELVTSVRVGDVLSGKYRIERILGAGGMGVVVAAHHLQLDERVAIKFLLPEGMQSPEARARFDREARAAVKIKNEHVARTIDVGNLENGAPYIVMEYLEGSDLANTLRARGSLTIEEAVEFVLQASEAIAEAHAIGIVHRDLKPENLFVVRRADGLMSVKVLDFGISKMTGLAGSGRDHGMTRTSTIMGSPLYMSPEQMQSTRDVDARTDIWAIGAIMYELLCGRPPFVGESMPELVAKILTMQPEPMLNFRPDTPKGLENVIMRCLQKDRFKRFENVAELALALVEFGPKRARASAERITRTVQAAGLSKSALALPPSSDGSSEPPKAGTMASWGQTSPMAAGSRRGIWSAVIFIALAFVGAAIVWTVRQKNVKSVATVVTTDSVAPGAPSSDIAVEPPPPPPPSAPTAATTAAPTTLGAAPIASTKAPDRTTPPPPPPVKVGTPQPRWTPPPQQKPPTAPTAAPKGDLGGRY